MRIQWSSAAAQELLERLARADQGLRDCARQSELVRLALADANEKGDDQALKKASERFEECARRLRLYSERVELFEAAVRRADERFEEAEASAIRQTEQMDSGGNAPVFGEWYGNWTPAAFMVMPDMRVSTAPGWLKAQAERSGRTQFLE